MLEDMKKRLGQITNPATGKTFDEENRWQDIRMDGASL